MHIRQNSSAKSLNDDDFQLAEVAWLYYGQDWTQEQIARSTGLSRPTISRMLRDARDRGIVEIHVHYPFQTLGVVEDELRSRLGLVDCKVLAAKAVKDFGEGKEVAHRVGALAARYLQEQIPDESVIGLGWGSMVHNVVRSAYLKGKRGTVVAQIQGSIGGETADIDGAGLAAALGRQLGSRVYTLSAPMVVADVSVRTGLLRDQHIRNTLEIGKRASIIIVGVGAVSHQSGLYRAGYLNDGDLEFIRGQRAVGDVCGSYFSQDGSLRPLELNERMIALDANAIRQAPLRVGISCGVEKVLPNIGAARSGMINVLVTDEDAALGMLRILNEDPTLDSESTVKSPQ